MISGKNPTVAVLGLSEEFEVGFGTSRLCWYCSISSPFPSGGFSANISKMPVQVCPWQVLLGQRIVSPVAVPPWNFFTLLWRGEISQMKWYFPNGLQIWGISPIYIALHSVIIDARSEKPETERESWQVLKLKCYWLSHLTCSFIPVLYSKKQMFNLFWIKGFNLW